MRSDAGAATQPKVNQSKMRHLFDPMGCLTLTVAACSILYELILAHTLSLLAANTVIWYSVVVGFFLFGMGVGAAFDSRFLSSFNPWRKFILVELVLALIGSISVSVLHMAHAVFLRAYVYSGGFLESLGFFAVAVILALIIGLLTGVELPVLMTLAEKRYGKDNVSRILGWDYLGSLLGAISFPFIILPLLELPFASIAVAAINLFVAIIVLCTFSEWRLWKTHVLSLFAFCLALAFIQTSTKADQIEQFFLQQYYYFLEKSDDASELMKLSSAYPEVERSSSPYQKIDIFHDVTREPDEFLMRAYSDKFKKEPDYPEDKMLFLNGDFQINTTFDEIYHEYFAHVPISMRGSVPKRTLVLGGGDGLLLFELLKYKDIEIRHIDLDRELVRLAKTHPILTKANRNAMNDPRVNTEFADGYHFIRTTDETFDAIYIDFPAAVDYNLAKLYSREFFRFVRERLNPGGFVVFDATGIGMLTLPSEDRPQQLTIDNNWDLYYNTLKAAGYEQIEPYITTLEIDNDRIIPELMNAGMNLPIQSELGEMLDQVDSNYERQALKNVFYEEVAIELSKEFVLGLQQGFITLAEKDGTLQQKYHDFGVHTYVYNERRFHLAFEIDFPKEKDVDWSKVNSILRPTFPDGSIWFPRVAF